MAAGFPYQAQTNCFSIAGFSQVHYRIYADDKLAGLANVTENAGADRVELIQKRLKFRARAHYAETILRQEGCLTSVHAAGPSIWVFSRNGKFPSDKFLESGSSEDPGHVIAVGEVKLFLRSPAGHLPLRNLTERIAAARYITDLKMRKTLSVHVMFYESFIAAVTKSISREVSLRGYCLPLNGRTFIDRNQSARHALDRDDDPSSISKVMSSISIEPWDADQLMCTIASVHQSNLFPLCVGKHPLHINVWLSPSGRVARYKGPERPDSKISWRINSSGQSDEYGLLPTKSTVKLWKRLVLNDLRSQGIEYDNPRKVRWAEIDAKSNCEEISADQRTTSRRVRRLLWPADLCFTKRGPFELPATDFNADIFNATQSDVFETANELRVEGIANEATTKAKKLGKPGSKSAKSQEQAEIFRKHAQIESLAPPNVYADLQMAGAVYPTPPDGLPPGMQAVEESEAAPVETPFSVISRTRLNEEIDQGSTQGTNAGQAKPQVGDGVSQIDFAVGTGMFGADDDEDDLFGGMDVDNFGGKGVTDDDFNFFDSLDDSPALQGDDLIEESDPTPGPALVSDGINPEPVPSQMPEEVATTDAEDSPETVFQEEELKEVETVLPNIEPEAYSFIDPHPLDPTRMHNALFSSFESPDSEQPKAKRMSIHGAETHHPSHYDPVAFREKLDLSDRKYSADGRFFFNVNSRGAAPLSPPVSIQIVPTLHASGKFDDDDGSSDDVSTTTTGELEESFSDLEESADHSGTSEGKRKRRDSDEGSITTSASTSVASFERIKTTTEDLSIVLADLSPDIAEWSLMGYFSSTDKGLKTALNAKQQNRWQLSHTILDQVTQSSLSHSIALAAETDVPLGSYFPDLFQTTASNVFGKTTRNDLAKMTGHRESGEVSTGSGSVEPLATPYIHLKRTGKVMELLSSAVNFWQTLGLEPNNGPKDVVAFCIYPHNPSILNGADSFLERLGKVYRKCKLGSHERGGNVDSFRDGLAPWKSDAADYKSSITQLQGVCEELARYLATLPETDESAVVYIINPFQHGPGLADICTAFLDLFEAYKNTASTQRRSARPIEVIPQIIPLDFIATTSSIVIRSQAEYVNLAFEVYGRYPTTNAKDPMFPCGAAFDLAEPIPKSIVFKRASNGPSSIFKEGNCLHIALSQSLDDRWITAVWSDNFGAFQMSMPYCVRQKGSSAARPYADIRAHIWETTWEIIRKARIKWRLILAIDGSVDNEDVDAWASFVTHANQAKSCQIELTIVIFDVRNSLSLTPSALQNHFNLTEALYSTPVSTPNVFSPEQAGNASTPAAAVSTPGPGDTNPEIPEDSLLVDITDETWSILLAKPLNVSKSLVAYKPSLKSGYLIRRQGPLDTDGVTSLLVHLMWTQSEEREGLFKEILSMWRNLATLARTRGIACARKNTFPWHIATAVRGQQVLSEVL